MLNEDFIDSMKNEILKNQHKGDWKNWNPSKEEWLWQTTYHLFKLQKAIIDNNKDLIKEYSSDLGNFSEKSYTTFGIK
jgi:hypothetical protein